MFCFIFVEGDDPDCFTEFVIYKKNGKCNGNKQRKCFHFFFSNELNVWHVKHLHATYSSEWVINSKCCCDRASCCSKCTSITRGKRFMFFF